MTQNDTTSSRTSESSGAVESAYRYIRGSIIRGELTSGEVLLESNLAERIGVSRTPVREALSRLASEGLVVLGRYRRAQVASFSMVDVAEVFRLRGKLEGHAARRACLRITTADIQRLEAIEAAGDLGAGYQAHAAGHGLDHRADGRLRPQAWRAAAEVQALRGGAAREQPLCVYSLFSVRT